MKNQNPFTGLGAMFLATVAFAFLFGAIAGPAVGILFFVGWWTLVAFGLAMLAAGAAFNWLRDLIHKNP